MPVTLVVGSFLTIKFKREHAYNMLIIGRSLRILTPGLLLLILPLVSCQSDYKSKRTRQSKQNIQPKSSTSRKASENGTSNQSNLSQSSPQAVFQKAQFAVNAGKHRMYYQTYHPDRREFAVARRILLARFTVASRSSEMKTLLKSILQKYGLKGVFSKFQTASRSTPFHEYLAREIQPLKKKQDLFVDISDYIEQKSDSKPQEMYRYIQGALGQVSTSGNRATGRLIRSKNGKQQTIEWSFRKRNGAWYIWDTERKDQ